ncbi:ATR-interacting protein-like [Mya arenaria]|uniref:ATR-interacting protein-like n=1 Tax=Mya arenaria TaxID=6604 RepID=UPI0022E350AF|nr:ATR-interacting protein-like [Mya arenaria]
MAARSLLNQLGWHSGKYKVNKEASRAPFTVKQLNSNMAGNYKKQDENEPPSKKRRTEEEGLWDDSMEFTQADLGDIDDLEMQASQAVKQQQPSTSKPTASTAARGSLGSGEFARPVLSRSSSSSLASHNSSSRNTSSSSRGSSHHNVSGASSHSNYPSSISGYNTSNSASIKSGSSSDHGNAQFSSLSRGLSSESLDVSSLLQSNQSISHEINIIKQENASLHLQVDRMKEEGYVKEGEIQLLRDNLKQKDSELDSFKQERINSLHQQNLHTNEREKHLQSEVTKLQTQLQFKEQEQRELTDRCRELEARLSALTTQPSTSMSQAIRPSQMVSPKPRRILVEERSPKAHGSSTGQGHSGFPSTRSFMSAEVSPVKVTKVKDAGSETVVTAAGDNEMANTRSKLSRALEGRRAKGLVCRVEQRRSNASKRFGARLLEVPVGSEGPEGRGMVGLLNNPTTSPSLLNVQFERDRNTSLLSPARSLRLTEFKKLVERVEQPEMISLVKIKHLNMAISGFSAMIKPSTDSDQHMSWTKNIQSGGTSQSVRDGSKTHASDSALFILPLIDDYLRCYVEMMVATLEISASSTESNGTVTASSSSSEPSPSGSLAVFLKSSATFANDLEGYCVAALRALHVLLACPSVRSVLLNSGDGSANVSRVGEMSQSDKELAPPSPGRGPSPAFCGYVANLQTLPKLFKLCNPGMKLHLCCEKIVIHSLQIVTYLTQYADEKQFQSLLPAVCEEWLPRCLEMEDCPQMTAQSLYLVRALLHHNQAVSLLCTAPSGCLLLSLYSLCAPARHQNIPSSTSILLAHAILGCIQSLTSCHKGGLKILLESDCECSVEVVKSLVYLLNVILKIHKHHFTKVQDNKLNDSSTSQTLSDIKETDHQLTQFHGVSRTVNSDIVTQCDTLLRVGLHLLHLIWQQDAEFYARHIPVQNVYVQLICGLTHIFRRLPNHDHEMNALHDLWDFNQDDSELSQASDSDTDMDQT